MRGQTIEKNTGKALPGVSVYYSDQSGKPVGSGTNSTENGSFLLPDESGSYLTARMIGFDPIIWKISAPFYVFELEEKVKELPGVNIIASRTNLSATLLFLGLALLLISSKK